MPLRLRRRAHAPLFWLALGISACGDEGPDAAAFAGLPLNGDDVAILGEIAALPSGRYEVGHVTIGNASTPGIVRCAPGANIQIVASSISIVGSGSAFECGTPAAPFTGTLQILLRPPMTPMVHDHQNHDAVESGTLAVSNGGTLRLTGGRAETFAWLHLARDVDAGSSLVTVDSAVQWRVGDRIALAPTGYNYAEGEERIIASVAPGPNGTSLVTVTEPFAFRHSAFSTTYQNDKGAKATLDERGEVANLTRNILITSADPPADTDARLKGVGVMIMRGGVAEVDGVEISYAGQLGEMGRYPFHWHLVGDASHQFLKNSSIHHSYQRCVTVHGTNATTVTNNVCYDHIGHGFFFETGTEQFNEMSFNLGMRSRRAPPGMGLLDSDMRSEQVERFAAPSTFWITNPNNKIYGNVAAGSQGTGFWMAFSRDVVRDEAGGFAGAPATTPTDRFSDNTAHAAQVGITWDGAEDGEPAKANKPGAKKTVSTHYFAPNAPTFANLKVYKNVASGIYFRGDRVLFDGTIAADNGVSFFLAYTQEVANSLVVGLSGGVTASELAYAAHLAPGLTPGEDPVLTVLAGVRLYDGPFTVRDSHFADFKKAFDVIPSFAFYNIGGSERSENVISNLTFGKNVDLVDFNVPSAWTDTPFTTAVRDASTVYVPKQDFNWNPGCTDIGLGYACAAAAYQWGSMNFLDSWVSPPYDATRIPMSVDRTGANGTIAAAFDPAQPFKNKIGMITSTASPVRYRVTGPVNRWIWRWRAHHPSPEVEFPGMDPAKCHVNFYSGALPNAGALPDFTDRRSAPVPRSSLMNQPITAYALENGSLYLRATEGRGEIECDP